MVHLTAVADEATFLLHVRQKLGARAANRFSAALAQPSTTLVDRVLRPHLFQLDHGGDIEDAVYYPVAILKRTPGRNHELAQGLATGSAAYSIDAPEPWAVLSFFANALRACRPDYDEQTGQEIWQPPSERVVFGPFHVFTFEHDVPGIDFLAEQMSWVMSRKKPSDSKMGRLFARLSEHADFAGLTANYSGGKSLHIHAVYDMRLAVEALNLGIIADLRRGFVAHWHLLAPTVRDVLGLPPDVGPDPMLSFPEAYRRLPNAFRLIEGDHVLGVPPGTWVRQVTLFEQWRNRAASGVTGLFFRPEPFHQVPVASRTRPPSSQDSQTFVGVGDLTSEQIAFCEKMLKRHFGDWPRLSGLTHLRGRWTARFFNSPEDQNATSVLRDDHRNILLSGRGAEGLRTEPLQFPLWRMIRLWVAQHARLHHSGGEAVNEEEVVVRKPVSSVSEHPEEAAFREAAQSSDARTAMRAFFLSAVPAHQLLWVRGPEGSGKSSALFAEHHRIIERIEAPGDPQLALYGFGDYRTAVEKCTDFNEAQRANGFIGVLLPSFSEAYARACAELSLAPLSQGEAARRGYSSLWAAVKATQPEVMESFKSRHTEMWASVGDSRLVGFTVHPVLHNWQRESPTRTMWARSFWEDAHNEAERRERAFRETALGLAVHDEVRVESIVEMQPLEVLQWVKRACEAHEPARGRVGIDRQHAAFQAFVRESGPPTIGTEVWELSFDDFRRMASAAFGAWTQVTTRSSGEYEVEQEAEAGGDGDRPDIYAARHGRVWAIQPRMWWNGLAIHVIALTTEALPTAVARRADPSWSVFELDAPSPDRGDLQVHAVRGVTARNLSRLCEEWRDRLDLPGAWVVSNRVASLSNSMSHARARGSNELIGTDIIQTMAFMSPDEYERVQALNAWMRRSDACLLRHIDELNQTSGRNLGFRGRAGCQNHLLVNPRLFALLLEGAVIHSRYGLVLHLDRGQRYRLRAE
ncbi:hypothetical protein [Falsiroseomonas sp. E2-1-a20]|uniref:hypothetical protein n=1 Tax=Falsiroseomonas sp. E2-1-a20 TaxID=3239300 RepID=UPI003F3331A3